MLSPTQKKIPIKRFSQNPSISGQNKLHELFFSLTSAWELARLAKREIASSHSASFYLEKVAKITEHAIQLTNEFSSQSRNFEDKVQPLDLNKVLWQSLASLDSTLFHGINLHLHLNAGLPAVNGQDASLQLLFCQILTNAAEAIQPQTGEIKIEVNTIMFGPEHPLFEQTRGHRLLPGPKAYVTIADTGTGMAPGTLDKAFDPFFTTKPLGKGLGLPTALEIINQLEGGIAVSSRLTNGTAVTVFLPVAQSFN